MPNNVPILRRLTPQIEAYNRTNGFTFPRSNKFRVLFKEELYLIQSRIIPDFDELNARISSPRRGVKRECKILAESLITAYIQKLFAQNPCSEEKIFAIPEDIFLCKRSCTLHLDRPLSQVFTFQNTIVSYVDAIKKSSEDPQKLKRIAKALITSHPLVLDENESSPINRARSAGATKPAQLNHAPQEKQGVVSIKDLPRYYQRQEDLDFSTKLSVIQRVESQIIDYNAKHDFAPEGNKFHVLIKNEPYLVTSEVQVLQVPRFSIKHQSARLTELLKDKEFKASFDEQTRQFLQEQFTKNPRDTTTQFTRTWVNDPDRVLVTIKINQPLSTAYHLVNKVLSHGDALRAFSECQKNQMIFFRELKKYPQLVLEKKKSPVSKPAPQITQVRPVVRQVSQVIPVNPIVQEHSVRSADLEPSFQQRRYPYGGITYNYTHELLLGMSGKRGRDHCVSDETVRTFIHKFHEKICNAISQGKSKEKKDYYVYDESQTKVLNVVIGMDPKYPHWVSLITAYYPSRNVLLDRFKMTDVRYQHWLDKEIAKMG